MYNYAICYYFLTEFAIFYVKLPDKYIGFCYDSA